MLTFEALTISFFAVLVVAAPFTRANRAHRLRAALRSAAVVACVLVSLQTIAPAVRVWLGHAYLVMAYWIPALMIPARSIPGAFEAWLVHTDQWWRPHRIAIPNRVLYLVELSYLLCYPLVPAAFIVIRSRGTLTDLDRFWTAVLISGFASYGLLPWLVSRPPRVRRQPGTTTPEGAIAGLRRFNAFVLARVSHGLNSFPSGHVAVSVAAGFEVMSVSRPAGLVMLLVAAFIAVGAVAGRYHYAVDVASGIVVGVAASALV